MCLVCVLIFCAEKATRIHPYVCTCVYSYMYIYTQTETHTVLYVCTVPEVGQFIKLSFSVYKNEFSFLSISTLRTGIPISLRVENLSSCHHGHLLFAGLNFALLGEMSVNLRFSP